MAILDDIAAIPARIEALKRKLKARDGKPEFKTNCEQIKAEIARLENVTAEPVASDPVEE